MLVSTKDLLGFDIDLKFRKEHVCMIRGQGGALSFVPYKALHDPVGLLEHPTSIRTHVAISEIVEGEVGSKRYCRLGEAFATRHMPDVPDKWEGRRRAVLNAVKKIQGVSRFTQHYSAVVDRIIAVVNSAEQLEKAHRQMTRAEKKAVVVN